MQKLTKVVLAAVMAMSICGTALAAPYGHPDNTRGRVVHVEYQNTTDSDGLNDPNINHPELNHDSDCGEYLHDTDLTVGDLNKVTDALVANEQMLSGQIKDEATQRANADIKSGSVVGTDIVLKKGDNSTVIIDASSLVGSPTDTYVTAGSYASDSQTITLERNNGKDNINIKLDDVAKASDVNNLEERVSTNETNIQNLDNRVTNNTTNITNLQGDVNNLEERVSTNETNIQNLDNRVTNNTTNITNLQGDVNNLEERVSTNETNIQNLQGDTIKDGNFADNTITLNRNSGENAITMSGIASTTDVQNEAAKRAADDIVKGSLVDNNIVLTKGSGDAITIDASALKDKDTYVTAGSYSKDSQTITLERNNGKENINIKLDDVAKASDVSNLDNRVTNNTTNIQTNTTNINKVQGDTIKDGNFADNTITLNRNSGENAITMDGIASVQDVEKEAAKRADDDIVKGSLVDNNIVLTKGSGDEIKIDASSLVGSVTDTYVTAGSYNKDSQTITLERNNGKENINIKLDDVAKAGNVTNLEKRVSTNETNITTLQGDVTNLDNRVTNNTTNITKVQGDVTNLEKRVSTNETNIQNIDGRVTKNETNIKNLQGDVINGGTFANNTITLTRVSGENPVVIGDIASAQDLQSEVTRSTGKDDEHDKGIAANKAAIEAEVQRSTGKDDEHDAGIAANKAAIEAEVQRSTGKDAEHDAGIAANKAAIENEAKVRENADNVLPGEDIASGHMDGNTLVLNKNNKKTVEVDGIATTADLDNLQGQVSNNKTEIQNNKERIEKETKERQAEDKRLDERIDGIEQNVGNLGGEIRRLDGRINKGVALAIAHASLKPLQYDPHYKFSGAFGVGSFHGENAIAAGLFYQPNENIAFNLSISNCGSEKGFGGGVSIRFK